MKIQNLCEHSTNGVVDYYTADLVENETTITVEFSMAGNREYIAYNLKTEMIYPIESVGNKKLDIKDWRDGDDIVLGGAIPRDN